jgi:hypothetical protein
MEKFTLELDLGNEAMQDHEDVARELHAVADQMEMQHDADGRIHDPNGNTVGSFRFEERRVTKLTPEIEKIEVVVEADDAGTYEDSEGVFARALIKFGTPQGGHTGYTVVRTPGLWDITHLSNDYARDVAEEELYELDAMLAALGLTKTGDQIDWSAVEAIA